MSARGLPVFRLQGGCGVQQILVFLHLLHRLLSPTQEKTEIVLDAKGCRFKSFLYVPIARHPSKL